MKDVNSFFLSKILHKEIINITGLTIGKLNDFVMDFNKEKPTVEYIEVKSGSRIFYLDASALSVSSDEKESYEILIDSESIHVKLPMEEDIFLVRDFLDKQIVDVNGRKVVRVNDVRLGKINNRWLIVAVDIGTRGLLRRLGAEYAAIRISEAFNRRIRNKLIVWDKVQPLSTGSDDIKLSTTFNKIKTMHAADIADIIEDLDNKSRSALFQSFDDEQAAEILEEIETDVQVNLLESLTDEKASDLLEIMPADEAADILEEMEEVRAETLLTQMDKENSEEIRELMEYEDETVGSIMSKEYIAFLPDITAGDALEWLRENKFEEEETYYAYVVNNKNNLLGSIALIDLLTSDLNIKLYNIMAPRAKSIKDDDSIYDAFEIMQKYHLVAMPVIDDQKELSGILSINDLLYEYVKMGRSIK